MQIRCSQTFDDADVEYDFDSDIVPAVGDELEVWIDGKFSGKLRVLARLFKYQMDTRAVGASAFEPVHSGALLHVSALPH